MKDDEIKKKNKRSFMEAFMNYGARDAAKENSKKNKASFLDKKKLKKFSIKGK